MPYADVIWCYEHILSCNMAYGVSCIWICIVAYYSRVPRLHVRRHAIIPLPNTYRFVLDTATPVYYVDTKRYVSHRRYGIKTQSTMQWDGSWDARRMLGDRPTEPDPDSGTGTDPHTDSHTHTQTQAQSQRFVEGSGGPNPRASDLNASRRERQLINDQRAAAAAPPPRRYDPLYPRWGHRRAPPPASDSAPGSVAYMLMQCRR